MSKISKNILKIKKSSQKYPLYILLSEHSYKQRNDKVLKSEKVGIPYDKAMNFYKKNDILNNIKSPINIIHERDEE